MFQLIRITLTILLMASLGCEQFSFVENYRSQSPESNVSLDTETTTKVERR